jgi:hypothetical protein
MLDVSVHVTQGTSAWEALTAIGALSAALVALFLGLVLPWCRRPCLKIDYQPGAPCCRDAPIPTPEGSVPAHWVRVKVTNKGRGAAKRCIGKMIAVYGADGRPRDDRDPMRLYWAGQSWKQPPEPLDLARHEFEYLGVVYAQGDKTDATLISTHRGGTGFPKELEAGRLHKVRLAVYADNAEPKTRDFEITFNGDIDTLKMRPA